MKLFSSALLTAAIAASLVSCSSLEGLGDSMTSAATGGGGPSALDQAKNMPAPNSMTLPPSPAVGQAWTMDMSGMKTTTAIVAEVDGQFIVEQEITTYGDPVIVACQVDPSANMMRVTKVGEAYPTNVTAAWIGLPGEKPMEHKVAEAYVMQEMPATDMPVVESTSGRETVNVGGRSWDAEWSESAGMKNWQVNGFTIRSDYNGSTTQQITEWKTDAKPALDWSAAE